MTTPDLSGLIPLKWKTWVALAGSLLSVVVPLVVSVEDYLPSPWPAVIGGVIALLTTLGVYHAPYVPPNTTVVPDVQASPPPERGAWRNPWQN